MRLVYFTAAGMVIIAAALGLWLVSLHRSPAPEFDPVQEATLMETEAQALRDTAALMRTLPENEEPARVLDQRASELLYQAAVLRRADRLPAAGLADQFRLKAVMLADSVWQLRSALAATQGTLTASQKQAVAYIDLQARNLIALADRLGRAGLNNRQQLELYRSCIVVYGKGARACDQLRAGQSIHR